MKPAYLWLDVETTGLDVPHSALLEVGCVVVDRNLEVLSTFERVVHFSRDDVHPAVTVSAFAAEAHRVNGLWSECERSPYDLPAVDFELTIWTRAFLEPGSVVLGGRSVHFDRRVVELFLPDFAGLLHHRHFETNTLRFVADNLGWPQPAHGATAHRALPDVLADLTETRELIGRLTAGQGWFTL